MTRLVVDSGAVRRLPDRPQTQAFMLRVGRAVQQQAQAMVGVATGELQRDIGVQPISGGGVRVGSDLPYARVHHTGRREVRPVRARVLVWRDPRSGQTIFARRSRAVGPNEYLTGALDKVRGSRL